MGADLKNDTGYEFVRALNNIVKKGCVNRLKIKMGDIVLLDIPVNPEAAEDAIDKAYLPALKTIDAIAGVVSKVQVIQVIIERPGGRIEVINNLVSNY